MMLALSSFLLLCTAHDTQTGLPPQTPPRRPPVYNVSLLLIGRNVDDLDPVDQQLGWGLEWDGYDPRDQFGWELGVSRTSDDESSGGADFETKVVEFYVGPRKTWGDPGELHPYVAIGLSWVDADLDVSGGASEDDSSFGLYGHGGAYWNFGKHFNVGADVRALAGTDIGFGDANYVQVGVVLGYSM